ncbi:peptide MFS transporter [Thalassotalea crassostreae]|uniref:peptide MFS transporter n=1 Tax=Thalassotalea crassostreae TaxID=1763536 RepID=UPI0008396709|nr:peptide MFS transporter [Thalassotalea crassostreae]
MSNSNQGISAGTMFGHPKGLFLLFGTELWERFSYYAMRAILVLYLTSATTEYGLGWTTGDAIQLYAYFTGLVYITPLIGGWLADNFIGQRKAIIIGGVLMALGQFALGTPHAWVSGNENLVFYIGLALLIAGNGLFKPNISTMVGDLYEEGDHRRDGAFTIFYMGINVGAFLSGIVVGSVVAAYSGNWQVGFICAGVGMLLSIIMQVSLSNKYLGNIGVEAAAKVSKAQANTDKQPLTSVEIDRLKVILILGLFTIIFWAGFEQAGGLMNIYADRFVDRSIGGFEVPTTWFQSLNPLFIVIFAPLIASIWIKMGDNEPNSPVKFALALVLLAIGFVFMIGATFQLQNDPSGKASMIWLILAYLFHTLGELCLSPIGLSMVTKLAPLRLASLMMGAWFGFTALANFVGGQIGSLIGSGDEGDMVNNAMSIFGGIAVASVISGVILYFMSNKLVQWMHGAEGPQEHHDDELEVTSSHEGIIKEH